MKGREEGRGEGREEGKEGGEGGREVKGSEEGGKERGRRKMESKHTPPHLCSRDHRNPIISFVFPLSMILCGGEMSFKPFSGNSQRLLSRPS